MQNNKNSVTVQKCVFSLFMTLCLPLIAHNSVIDCKHAGINMSIHMLGTVLQHIWESSFYFPPWGAGDAVAVWISDMISTEQRIFMN